MKTLHLLLALVLAPALAPAASAAHSACAGWDHFGFGAWAGQCTGAWVSLGPEFICLVGTNGVHLSEPVGLRAAVLARAGCSTGVLVTLP